MDIENLKNLLQAKYLHKSSLSKINFFCTELKKDMKACAFFAYDKKQASIAALQGAYVIIVQEEIKIDDFDISYLLVDDLDKALFRLARMLFIEKKLVLLNEIDFICAKRLRLNTLSLDIKKDVLNNEEIVFCNNLEYLNKLGANIVYAKNVNYKQIKNSSFFYQDLMLDDKFFQNIFVPQIFTQSFANLNALTNINIKDLELLDFVFLNDFNQSTNFGQARRVIIFEEEQIVYEKLQKALKNVFLCDDFKNILENNFNICLCKNKKNNFLDFLNTLNVENKDGGLW